MKFCFLFLFLLGGCAPTWNRQIQLEPYQTSLICISLPKKENIQEAKQAVETWNKALSGWEKLIPVIQDKCDNYQFSIEEVETPPEHDSIALAYVMLGQHHIKLVKNRYDKNNTYGIVLHEMGHALGAQHVKGTLMDPNYNPLTMKCPDYITVLQVAAWQHVGISNFTWCSN